MSNTPTPRTDANCFSVAGENPDPYRQDHSHHSGGDYVRSDFARELERENAELAKVLEFIRDECDWEPYHRPGFDDLGGDKRIGPACTAALAARSAAKENQP